MFLFYNIAGGLLRVVSSVSAGYLFGGLELVKNNFQLVILAIIFVSVPPAIIECIRAQRAMKSASVPPAAHSEKSGPTA